MAVKSAMKISEILQTVDHRPYAIPESQWIFYQEWHDTVFLHWEFPVSVIKALIPVGLEVDQINGKTYVSIVAFTVRQGRLFCTPAFPPVSNFHEVNVRVYVNDNGKPGIYFLSVEASKKLSAHLLRQITAIPYEYANINREKWRFRSVNDTRAFQFVADCNVGDPIGKNDIDRWLTERYALYVDIGKNLYRYDIHHIEWPLESLTLNKLVTNYVFQTFDLRKTPDHVHYSAGVQVVAWGKKRLS